MKAFQSYFWHTQNPYLVETYYRHANWLTDHQRQVFNLECQLEKVRNFPKRADTWVYENVLQFKYLFYKLGVR